MRKDLLFLKNYIRENYMYSDGNLILTKDIKFGYKKGHVFKSRKNTFSGYCRINIKNKPYYLHKIIWLLFNENVPENLDHINRIKHDNRIENLREATSSQNMSNLEKYKKNSSSKYLGVSFHKTAKKYISRIRYNGKLIHLGYFKNEREAANEYDKKGKELFGDYFSGNFNKL